jgi:acyl-CoA thioesterase-1
MSRFSRRTPGWRMLALCAGLTVGVSLIGAGAVSAATAPPRMPQTVRNHVRAARTDPVGSREPVIRVMIIGSSVAQGWKDDRGGYLRRAFRHLSRIEHVHYLVISRAVPGIGAGLLEAHIPGWIETVQPQVVIIAWGGLDDAYEHTPLDLFRELIREQVLDAIAGDAVCLVVTPPVSRASYTNFRVSQPEYLDAEMSVAQSLGNPNVYVFDVFDQMKTYLTDHGLSYAPFMADGWHPNPRGHALAGRLLTEDLVQAFGTRPINFIR